MSELYQRYRNAEDLRTLLSCVREFSEQASQADNSAPAVRVALTGNYSTQFFGKCLPLALAARGLNATLFESDYNAWQLDLINAESALYGFAPTHVVLLLTSIDLAYGNLRTPERIAKALADVTACVLSRTQARLLITLPEPLLEEIADQTAAYTWRRETRALLQTTLNDPRISLLDLDPLVYQAGAGQWHDERYYDSSKIPFHPDRLPRILAYLSAALVSTVVPQCKLVVCDLDNTLWAGSVGDDGWDGVRLDATGVGRYHLRLQLFLKGLAQQGVLLAIASKNEVKPVHEVFERRPEMLLKLEDFAATQIHWEPKSSSIERILSSLNLTSSAVVFLDDSAVERAEVARKFPELFIPDFSTPVAKWVPQLVNSGLFDLRVVSEESKQRQRLYQENAQRDSQLATIGDLDAFLADLRMVMTVYHAADHRERVVELIQKTNQFNLTTQRYNWQEVEAAAAGGLALCYRLADRFGDNGIISVVIVKHEHDSVFSMDLWLMSCRVMGRNVENAIMDDVLQRLADRGATRLLGRYIPSSKNAPVSTLYPKLGFATLAETGTEQRYEYCLDGNPYPATTPYIRKQSATTH